MQIRNRLSRIERSLGLSGSGGSTCTACRNAERRVIAIFNDEMPGFPAHPAPQPSFCPGCGRDLNSYVEVVFVDRIGADARATATHERYESSSGT